MLGIFRHLPSPQVSSGTILSNGVVVSTLTETDYPIAIPMINLVDQLLAHYKPVDPDLAFSKIAERIRDFFKTCHREEIVSILINAVGDEFIETNFNKVIVDFIAACVSGKRQNSKFTVL